MISLNIIDFFYRKKFCDRYLGNFVHVNSQLVLMLFLLKMDVATLYHIWLWNMVSFIFSIIICWNIYIIVWIYNFCTSWGSQGSGLFFHLMLNSNLHAPLKVWWTPPSPHPLMWVWNPLHHDWSVLHTNCNHCSMSAILWL